MDMTLTDSPVASAAEILAGLPLVEQPFRMREMARNGEIDAATWRETVYRLMDADLKTAYMALKAKQIELYIKLLGDWPRGTKAEMVQKLLSKLSYLYWVTSKQDTISELCEVGSSVNEYQSRMDAAVRKVVSEITDEDMDAYAAKYAEARAERAAALSDPKSLAEFKFFISEHGGRIDALTDEQLVRYDALCWESEREKIEAEQKRQATIRQIDIGDDVGMTVSKEWHTKRLCDIWIVRVSERVERDTYNRLAEAAKRLGGTWSTFSKGFLFWNEEDANTFAGVKDGDVSAADRWMKIRAMREERAADRLEEYALNRDGRAASALAMDRLTNTVRRASMADAAEGNARREQAMAAMIMSVATAQQAGELKILNNVRSAIQIMELYQVLRSTMHAAERALNKPYSGETVFKPDYIRYVTFPWPAISLHDAKAIVDALKGKRGTKYPFQALSNMVERASAKGRYAATAGSRAEADYLIELADMLPAGRLADNVKASLKQYQRLTRMGIINMPILRFALRELLPHVVTPAKADPIVEAERALIGTRIPGFFPTPPEEVAEMIGWADVEAGMRVLEPSAGKGNIVMPLLEAGALVTAIETNYTLTNLLRMKTAGREGVEVRFADFTEEEPALFDRAVMNPPFENGQDAEHVRLVFEKWLAPGGRLVAIMSNGPFYRSNNADKEFRAWFDEVGGEVVKELPAGTFYDEAGTNVATRMILIVK